MHGYWFLSLVQDGFQVAGRCRPLSKFMEFLQDLILMASLALLSQYPLTDLTSLGFPSQYCVHSWPHALQYRCWRHSSPLHACVLSVRHLVFFCTHQCTLHHNPCRGLVTQYPSSPLVLTILLALVPASRKTLQMLRGVHILSSLTLGPRM